MGRYKRIIAFSLVLILGLSVSFNCYASGSHSGGGFSGSDGSSSGSHSGGGFSNPDAITDEDMFEKQKENVDVELPAPADTTIQSSKNSKGETIHTLHWRNPASLVVV